MKDAFIQQIIITATALAQSLDTANALVNVFFDRSYGAAGVNEIVQADLDALGLAVGQIAAFITLAQQLQLLRNGQAVAVADYDSTLNALRHDL